MRQGLKKMLAALIVAATFLGLAGCGSSVSAEDSSALEQDYCKSVAESLLNDWNAMSAEDLKEIADADVEDIQKQIDLIESMGSTFPFTAEAFISACAGYESTMEDLGGYVSTIGYGEPELNGEDTVFVAALEYEDRDADLTLILNKRGIVESVTVDPKYSIGEILQKALMNTVLGMGTVFVVLIFLSFLIYCFKYVSAIIAFFAPVGALLRKIGGVFQRKQKEKPVATESSVPVSGKKEVPAKKAGPSKVPAAGEELVDDRELVAAITAAILAYRGNTGDDFVVRSIRRADAAKWKRA